VCHHHWQTETIWQCFCMKYLACYWLSVFILVVSVCVLMDVRKVACLQELCVCAFFALCVFPSPSLTHHIDLVHDIELIYQWGCCHREYLQNQTEDTIVTQPIEAKATSEHICPPLLQQILTTRSPNPKQKTHSELIKWCIEIAQWHWDGKSSTRWKISQTMTAWVSGDEKFEKVVQK
jgi:hypothetical protein